MTARRTLFVVVLLLYVSCCAVAQQSVQTPFDTLRSLENVVVWGSRDKEIVPSQRLDGTRLENLSSFSVADAIRYFAGVQIKDYGGVGGLKTVDVRSMGTNHMGVFYDGIQLGNAQNGQVDLGKFSLDNVESISLYNGQKSDIFQPAKDYGSAGSIYIRTRRPQFEAGKRYNLRISMKGGSFGLLNPSVRWEQQWTPKISSSISTEYVNATGKYKFRYRRVLQDGTTAWDTTAVRQNGDIESFRAEGSLFGKLIDGQWNVKTYYYDSEKGIPGAIVNNVWKREQRQWDRNFFLQGNYKKTFGKYELMINAKYAHDYMRYLNPDTTLMYLDNKFYQQELYVSVANHYSITDHWDVALSTDYQYNYLDATLQDFVYPKRHTMLWALASTYTLGRFRAMASLLGTHVVEKVTRIKYAEDDELLPGAQTGTPDNTNKFTPAVFMSFRALKNSNDLLLRAFYKRIFRMPTFNDLYYTDIGNIALKPEFATQYNIGVTYQHDEEAGFLRHIEAKADAYYNHVDDKIIAVPKGSGQYRWMMMNIGLVKIKGIDVQASAVMVPHRDWMLNLSLKYTYQKAQDFSAPTDNDPVAGTYGGQIAYIPWHSGSVIGNLTWKGWGMNYSFVYVGERYHVSSNILANHEQPWYTHDLSLTKDVRIAGCKVNLALECNNVLNQQYDVILNYPMPGRNWKGIVKWNF